MEARKPKRKPSPSSDPAIKRRKKQDTLNFTLVEDNPEVRSIQAELSTLESREIADLSQLASSLPHITFEKRTKPKPKKLKPPSTTSAPKPINDETLLAKKKQVAAHKEQARRSSFGRRGKRVSGSFDAGEPVIPHDSVPSDRLYRHIDSELPDPHRARHLLVWCARRAIPRPEGKASKLPSKDVALLATIQDRVVRQLMDLKIEIPLYATTETDNRALTDDPVNIRNREYKERLSKVEEQVRDEDAMWSKVVQDYNSLQSTVVSTLSNSKTQQTDIHLSELDDKWRDIDDELEFYRMECEKGTELDSKLAKWCRTLPLQLDSLRASLAKSTAFTEQAKEFIDQLFVSIGQTNSSGNTTKSVLSSISNTGSGSGSMDLFRTLAKTEASKREFTPEQPTVDPMQRRLTTIVQPSTPRKMPGTPKRNIGDTNGPTFRRV